MSVPMLKRIEQYRNITMDVISNKKVLEPMIIDLIYSHDYEMEMDNKYNELTYNLLKVANIDNNTFLNNVSKDLLNNPEFKDSLAMLEKALSKTFYNNLDELKNQGAC